MIHSGNIQANIKNSRLHTTDPLITARLYLFPELEAQCKTDNASTGICLTATLDNTLKSEEYVLDFRENSLIISYAKEAGLLYALQSIQMSLSASANKSHAAVQTVKDGPRFSWRGLMLDSVRHFFSVDVIKQILDLLFRYKMNRFHWHLTDDQGWRIEFPEYPELHTKASTRTNKDGSSHSGYYSIDDIKDIVSYAAERNIQIIPEIDLPGHSKALLSAYPVFSCNHTKRKITDEWGIFKDVPCISKDSFWTFMDKLTAYISSLFPSPWIHFGGDECLDTEWLKCPDCSSIPKGEHQRQFTQRIEKLCEANGKIMIGWDEIIPDIQSSQSMVMAWHEMDTIIEADKRNIQSIACPFEYCYLDYYQSNFPIFEPKAQPNSLTLKKMYSYNTEILPESCIGYQMNIWTEYIPTADHLFYMLLPRLYAGAEKAWGSDSSFKDFRLRLKSETGYWKKKKLKHRSF